MIDIDGYKITKKVNEGRNFIIYRGYASMGDVGKSFLFKVLKNESFNRLDVARFKSEYERLQAIGSNGLEKVHGIKDAKCGVVLILEDFNAIDLKTFLNNKVVGLELTLKVILQLAGSLNSIHKQNIIHSRIRPQNIMVNNESFVVKLSNFGVMYLLTGESEFIYDKYVIERSLPYISPEQTGRMNSLVDYRTDFYSLGIILFEMLIGEVPFKSEDPLEIIHSHIARKVIYPTKLNKDIPQSVSDITMKLLAKNAYDRYQSGYGLKLDLEECLNQLQRNHSPKYLALSKRDSSERFHVSQEFYGREKEINVIVNAIDRANHGVAEMVLVKGSPGIGKSTLINKVCRSITNKNGYFISGKYDQLKKDIPYNAIVQAFQELIEQIIGTSKEKLQIWKDMLLGALGTNGGSIPKLL